MNNIELANDFEYLAHNSIVNLNNTDDNTEEKFEIVHRNCVYYIKPLHSYLKLQTKAVIQFFQNMDDSFDTYLGIGGCHTEDEAIKEIQRLLDRERDGRHKYYLIQNQYNQIVGIFYIYEYHKKYKRCSLAIGISYEYRGNGISEKTVSDICNYLFSQGILRISLEVETTNTSSLRLCEKLCNRDGFEKEGILRNLYGKGIDSVVFSRILE